MTTDTAPHAVVCSGLTYAFGDTRAVDGLELTVREGEVFGLLGPSGAGKTTAIRCITTLLPVPSGRVRVFGHDAAGDRMAVRRLLGYVPQQLSADSGLTGRENVSLFARVFDVPGRERAARVAQALGAVGLAYAADRPAGTCSGGMVRRLELAQALVSAPRLLILDEPTIGLDPIARTGVCEHIAAVREATGMTVLVTTHYVVLSRDRLMGFGQAITMPLFFASNTLYPVAVMPGRLQAVSRVNPLSYEVDALRGLLLGTPARLGADFRVLAASAALGVAAASSLLGRLAR
ncbi:ATP-binding cassette domain-containing protein [Streptomyces sp. NPDC048481]|uniref:ATP-binding cassette domain-containing protein n=1 Tax=Streptomyces sp. NPDC048481 TaxID=3365557 RepID=UPI003719B6A4